MGDAIDIERYLSKKDPHLGRTIKLVRARLGRAAAAAFGKAGMSTAKATYVRNLAEWFDGNPKIAKKLPSMPDDEVIIADVHLGHRTMDGERVAGLQFRPARRACRRRMPLSAGSRGPASRHSRPSSSSRRKWRRGGPTDPSRQCICTRPAN